jgi:exopolysaccharide biosynthesis polyprenyl glycosylphosphotransferase
MKDRTDLGFSSPFRSQGQFALISSAIAYFASYLTLCRLVSSTLVNFSARLSLREVWLSAGLMVTWATLITEWNFGTTKYKSRIPSSLKKEILFLGILAALYVSRTVPNNLLGFFLIGSCFYLPINFLLHYMGFYLGRAGRLIQHDSQILIVGSKDRAKDAIAAIRRAGEKYEIVGCLDPDSTRVGVRVSDLEVLGTTADLPKYLFGHAVDLIMFALPLHLVPNAAEGISRAMEVGIPVSLVTECGLHRVGHCFNDDTLSYKAFAELPTAILSNVPGDSAYLVLKRVLDIVISAVLMVLLSPLFLLTAALIKLTSPDGPILYEWKVLGRNRKPFVGYKFRTMVPNAEQLKERLLQHNEMQGPVFKIKSDPRVTPLGRILRKYSIDELPQLYSVLKGDMSLVGPRPPAKHEADQFAFWQRRKLSVKPGITCLWQVNGRNEIANFDEWARLDIEYIKQASMSSDLRILLRTIPAVVRGKGAH